MKPLPLNLDLFALIILLGVAQGVFLGVFFLTGQRGRNTANQCAGWLMLALSAVISEMFLGYSNYMFRLLALVDFSEPLNFALGPLFFLFVVARLQGRLPDRWALHFIPAGLWSINAVCWLYQPVEIKYNNYLEAYHPNLAPIPEPSQYLPEDFSGLRDYVSELTLVSCLIYSVLAASVVYRAYRVRDQSFWRGDSEPLVSLRNLSLLFLVVPLLIAIVKPQFDEDLGDYILACYLTGVIYATSFLVMRGSAFFSTVPPYSDEFLPDPLPESKKKYEKSALSPEVENAMLTRLTALLATQKPFLDSTLSLPKLASQLGTSPHHLSQLLNDRLGLTFFDWLATQRIDEARQLLGNPATAHLKIDEIAERVGYNSPSAFHTAFKRLTSQTPAQYRSEQVR